MPTTPNDYVRVKLSAYGRDALRKQYKALQEKHPQARLSGDGVPNEDAEGWSEWQLWWLMAKLGPVMSAGAQQAFDDFEIKKR